MKHFSLSKKMLNIWHRMFLVERSSVLLSGFRIAAALTTGFHVLPILVRMDQNYSQYAFIRYNVSFFPTWFIEHVSKSPDWLIHVCAFLFIMFWFLFLIGYRSQLSCIVMTAMCYFFYALNSFQIGTLSWDILLVTLFLMCLTGYHGDYFSIDCLRKPRRDAFNHKRPYFIQRLLQLQIAFTFFYTALFKITGEGNWLTGNPIYYLMNYPVQGVVKTFLFKEFLAGFAHVCYWTGVTIVVVELSMIVLLFWHKTRISAIYLGVLFHILLILTLDVPAIFFFLFPAQLFLFINPDLVVEWIQNKRRFNQNAPQNILIFDGQCTFCRALVDKLIVMDLFNRILPVSLQQADYIFERYAQITSDKAKKQIYFIKTTGRIYSGFDAVRMISFKLPMTLFIIPILFLPGVGVLGRLSYHLVARHRSWFKMKPVFLEQTQ